MNPTRCVFDTCVVVGNAATPDATKDAPQVIALAVPLSLIRISNFWPSVGVPDKPEVIDVIAAAKAVMLNWSYKPTSIAGVAEDVVVPMRGVIRLLVRVAVAARSVELLVLSTLPKPTSEDANVTSPVLPATVETASVVSAFCQIVPL